MFPDLPYRPYEMVRLHQGLPFTALAEAHYRVDAHTLDVSTRNLCELIRGRREVYAIMGRRVRIVARAGLERDAADAERITRRCGR